MTPGIGGDDEFTIGPFWIPPVPGERLFKPLEICLVVHGATLVVLTVISLLSPSWIGNLANGVIDSVWLPSVVISSLESNYAILEPLSSAHYAAGFRALQLFAMLTEPIFIVAFLASTFVGRPQGTRTVASIIIFSVGALASWWCFFGGDFYSAHDRDFTGMLRPWVGSAIFSMVCWLIPLTISLAVYSFVPKGVRER